MVTPWKDNFLTLFITSVTWLSKHTIFVQFQCHDRILFVVSISPWLEEYIFFYFWFNTSKRLSDWFIPSRFDINCSSFGAKTIWKPAIFVGICYQLYNHYKWTWETIYLTLHLNSRLEWWNISLIAVLHFTDCVVGA
jgi:hypothetical protein